MLEKHRTSPNNSWGGDLPQTGWKNSAGCSSDASLVKKNKKKYMSSDRAIKPGYFCWSPEMIGTQAKSQQRSFCLLPPAVKRPSFGQGETNASCNLIKEKALDFTCVTKTCLTDTVTLLLQHLFSQGYIVQYKMKRDRGRCRYLHSTDLQTHQASILKLKPTMPTCYINSGVGFAQCSLYMCLCFTSALLFPCKKSTTANPPPASHWELAAFLHHWHQPAPSAPRNFTACLSDGISWQSLVNMGHRVLSSGDPHRSI